MTSLTCFLLDSDVEDIVRDILKGAPPASAQPFDEGISKATLGRDTNMVAERPSRPRMFSPVAPSQSTSSGHSIASLYVREIEETKFFIPSYFCFLWLELYLTCLPLTVRVIRAVRKETDALVIEEDSIETDLMSSVPVLGEYTLVLFACPNSFLGQLLILIGYLQE